MTIYLLYLYIIIIAFFNYESKFIILNDIYPIMIN